MRHILLPVDSDLLVQANTSYSLECVLQKSFIKHHAE